MEGEELLLYVAMSVVADIPTMESMHTENSIMCVVWFGAVLRLGCGILPHTIT